MKFTNAPLIRVVAKATLREPRPLMPAVAVNLCGGMINRFDIVQDLAMSEQPPGRPGIVESPSQIQGLFFGSKERPNFATIQPDMVSSRWMRQPERPEAIYPGYSAVASDLDFTASVIAEVWKIEKQLVASVVQLGYTDLVLAPGMTLSEVASRYLAPELMPRPTPRPFSLGDMNYGWRVGEIDMRLSISPGVIQPEGTSEATEGIEPIQAYSMDWIAGKDLSEGQSILSGMELLHREIEDLFVSSITEYAKEEWGYVEHD